MSSVTMFISIIFIAFSLKIISSDTIDSECKTILPDGSFIWSPRATHCENSYRDKDCEQQWGDESVVVEGGSAPRSKKCWMLEGANGLYNPGSGTWEPNDIVRRGSIDVCPKYCGYCCMASEYTCEWQIPAGYTPEIEQICKDVTWDKCLHSIAYRPIYAKYCPNFCGFCRINGCIDAISSCTSDICESPAMATFASQYCRHTCGYCEQCQDKRSDCAQLVVIQDLCNTASISTIRNSCGKTCKMC